MSDHIFSAGPNELEQLRNVANCVVRYTETVRPHNGKRKCSTYAEDIDTIAGSARQLAEMILEMTAPNSLQGSGNKSMATYPELISAVREALVAYKNHPGRYELETLVAVIQRMMESRHSVKVQTPRRLYMLQLPFKIVEPGKVIRFGPSNYTVRFAASAISHIQVDGTIILAGPNCYFFQETDVAHYERLRELPLGKRQLNSYGITLGAVRISRRALLLRLALSEQGIYPDRLTFQAYMPGTSFNLASHDIDDLMTALDVFLDGSVIRPTTNGQN